MSVPYGKLGNGHYLIDPNSTNDHANGFAPGSIQAACNSLGSGGGLIELTKGTYECGPTYISVPSNVEIRGIGSNSVIYKDQNSWGTNEIIVGIGSTKVKLKDFKIQGTVGSGLINAAIGFENADDLHIEGLIDGGVRGVVVYIANTEHIKISDCRFWNLRQCGVELNHGNHAVIENCLFRGYNDGSGSFQNSMFFSMGSTDGLFHNNTLIKDPLEGGWKLHSFIYSYQDVRFKFMNVNMAMNDSSGRINYGFEINDGENVTIEKCKLSGTQGTDATKGFYIHNSNACQIKDTQVLDLSVAGSIGVHLDFCSYCVAVEDHNYNCATSELVTNSTNSGFGAYTWWVP